LTKWNFSRLCLNSVNGEPGRNRQHYQRREGQSDAGPPLVYPTARLVVVQD